MDCQKEEDEKLKRYNAKLISLFLFQYTILIPLMIFMNSTLLVGIFSVIILVVAILRNRRFQINSKVLLLSLALLLLITIKMAVYHGDGYSVMISFFTVACPALYMISLPFDKKCFLETSYRLSVFSFFLIFWTRFVNIGIDYMRFGYAMAPISVFLYCQLVYQKSITTKKRVFLVVLLLVSVIEILILGARGSIIPIFIMIVLDKFIINKINYKVIFPLMLAVCIYLNIDKIINAIFAILDELNIHSYSIIKMRMQLNKGFEQASSGRDVIYEDAVARIKQSPFFGGQLMGGVGDSYTHDIFLQIAEEFGIFAVIIFSAFLLNCLEKMHDYRIQRNDRLVLAILFSISMGRLLFSSSYWMRPEFWLFVGFGLIIKKVQLQKKRVTQNEINK